MKKKQEFSKSLLIQESVLIWITTLICLTLTFYCVFKGFSGSLPWISSIVVAAWGAYGVSQTFYYKKSMAENTKDGIKFEAALAQIKANSYC